MQTQYIEKSKNGTFYYKDKDMIKLHREDGPAAVKVNGDRWWYLNGEPHREDGPAVEKVNGDRWWYLNGELHREDGPAIEWADGDRFWFLNGEFHREDGPAIVYADGEKEWYLNGVHFSEEEFNAKMNPAPIEMTIEEIATKLGLDAKRLKVIA